MLEVDGDFAIAVLGQVGVVLPGAAVLGCDLGWQGQAVALPAGEQGAGGGIDNLQHEDAAGLGEHEGPVGVLALGEVAPVQVGAAGHALTGEEVAEAEGAAGELVEGVAVEGEEIGGRLVGDLG